MTVPIPPNSNQTSRGFRVYPTSVTTFEWIPKPQIWIMTDDQRNRLTSLAQDIALENDLSLSIRIGRDGLKIGLYNIEEDEEEGDEE